MDERLEAGRHHLRNGEGALRVGALAESRNHFETALLQFRGPELRIGEAHALRGLSQVDLASGELAAAEAGVREAIAAYRDVLHLLHHFDHEGVSAELAADAREGEAAAHVVLGDVLVRAGRAEEARTVLTDARDLFQGVGEVPAAANLYLALGRLGLRQGKTSDARDALARAIGLLGDAGDVAGEAAARLLRAEADRLDGALDMAAAELSKAQALADKARDAHLVGRVHASLAGVRAQRGNLAEAEGLYTDALAELRSTGDLTAQAFALLGRGDVRSRRHDLNAIHDLDEAVRTMAKLEHRHGLGLSMLRLSEHLLRLRLPAYALTAAESARQLWLDLDPTRGVGQALRVQVKALATLKQWPAAVTVAEARAAVAGDVQPNAKTVADFYRDRAPAELFAPLEGLSPRQLEARAERMIAEILAPVLQQLDLDLHSLGLSGGVLELLAAVVRATPAPAPAREVASADEIPELPDDAWEVLPPEEERVDVLPADYVGFYDPPPVGDSDAEE
jgi:tetratricopeptide (TPR) repeat protein